MEIFFIIHSYDEPHLFDQMRVKFGEVVLEHCFGHDVRPRNLCFEPPYF